MCDDCIYNQDGYCVAPGVWWKEESPDGSCSLFKPWQDNNTQEEEDEDDL